LTTTTTAGRIPSFFLYGEAPRTHDERTLHIETIECRSARHRWKIDPHVHRSLHQLVFVLRGRGMAFAESHVAEYRSPALMLVPAGTVHGFVFEPGTEGFVVSMSDDLLNEIARREPGIDALFRAHATLELRNETLAATDLEQSFTLLAREFERSAPGHHLALEGLLDVILANLLRLAESAAERHTAAAARNHELVARFRKLVERDYRKSRAVAEYAAELNVSESRLRNACLGVTEQPPLKIVHARILLEAKRALVYTGTPVSEIAYALGFDDPAYFTRFFSRRTGLAPREFRARGPRGAARVSVIGSGT
jgi:AraC family transcriptional activator of pobA